MGTEIFHTDRQAGRQTGRGTGLYTHMTNLNVAFYKFSKRWKRVGFSKQNILTPLSPSIYFWTIWRIFTKQSVLAHFPPSIYFWTIWRIFTKKIFWPHFPPLFTFEPFGGFSRNKILWPHFPPVFTFELFGGFSRNLVWLLWHWSTPYWHIFNFIPLVRSWCYYLISSHSGLPEPS